MIWAVSFSMVSQQDVKWQIVNDEIAWRDARSTMTVRN
jgi:hypothetical protein